MTLRGRLRAALDGHALLARLHRLDRAHRGRQRLPRDRSEVLAREREHLLRIDVAGDHEGAVVRRVVGLEEAAQVGERPALDVGGPADGREVVGVGRERRALHLFGEEARVVVLDAKPPL